MVVLRPFTEDLLSVVQPWFLHPEVNRWLGGPEWPARTFEAGEDSSTFRGRRVLRGHSWVAVDEAGDVVAQIGGEIYDHWYHDEPGPAMGLAYVVDPQRWRQGIGTAALLAVMSSPEVADAVLFAAGIEPENTASVRCALAAGLRPDSPIPDFEGIVYHLRRFPERGADVVE